MAAASCRAVHVGPSAAVAAASDIGARWFLSSTMFAAAKAATGITTPPSTSHEPRARIGSIQQLPAPHFLVALKGVAVHAETDEKAEDHEGAP